MKLLKNVVGMAAESVIVPPVARRNAPTEPNTTMKTATITDKQVATCEAILASKGEIVKHYPDEPEFRRASVTIRPTDSDEYAYDVIMCHENWTGARWVSICNRDEAYSLEHAICIARDMARYFVA